MVVEESGEGGEGVGACGDAGASCGQVTLELIDDRFERAHFLNYHAAISQIRIDKYRVAYFISIFCVVNK